MLELMIAIFPGIFAFYIYRKTQEKIQWNKLISYILFYTLFTNLCILLGLYLIGMRRFNLFDMSIKFKVKWILLEFILASLITIIITNIRNLNLAACKNIFIRLFPAMLFFIVTYAVFTPSSLFFGNIEEFSIHYAEIVPILLFMSPILALGIYIIALCLSNEKFLHIFIAFLFNIALSLYVQGNFLNPELPTLDGVAVDWELYGMENIVSIFFWFLCLFICLALSCFRKEKTEKTMKYIAYFICAVQLTSLMFLIITTKYDESLQSGYLKDDIFTIGSEENIIIFIVDTLQADTMAEYIASNVYAEGSLDDFTFFDNAVSGAAPTKVALPLLLTGLEYDPTQPLELYLQEVWEETELYNDLHNNGYNVCLFTNHKYMADPPEGVIDNFKSSGEYKINNYPLFTNQLYKLVNLYLMPQCLKQYFWLSDSSFQVLVTDEGYDFNDYRFYADLHATENLKTKYKKTFRLYHLDGVHLPYYIDENAEYTTDETVTEQQVLQGNMKIIYEYVDKLKQADIYDKSTIIILGDHGRHEKNNIESNPAVLLKLPYESHELASNSSPIHFRNLYATMAGTIMEDYSHYGPSVFDITEDSDVERLHTIDNSVRKRANLQEAYNTETKYTRLIIEGEADSDNYQVWYPYEINHINYQIGDVIDFTKNNDYAEQINYRLYKENGAAIASNELCLCFELENNSQKDLEFHFIYSGIYNDSQKIGLYANGNKIENIICTKDGIGQENVSVISSDYIEDGKLILRMVFSGAVTPNQLDRNNTDTRVLSVAFASMWLEQ